MEVIYCLIIQRENEPIEFRMDQYYYYNVSINLIFLLMVLTINIEMISY